MLTEAGSVSRGGRGLLLVPGVPVGRALLVYDLLEGLCSSFAFVHFSGLKGQHQGPWL